MTSPPEPAGPPCGEPGHDPGCDVPWGPPLTEADYAELRQHVRDIEAGWQAQDAERAADNARVAMEAERNEAEAGL